MVDDLGSILSKFDALSILDFCNETLAVRTKQQMNKLVLSLQQFFTFEFAFCYYVDKQAFVTLEPGLIFELRNINYPDGILEDYLEASMYHKDPVVKEYAESIKVQNWQECFARHEGTGIIEPLADNGIIDGFTHGAAWADSGCAFSFASKYADNIKRTKEVLTFTIPHLGEALKRVMEIERTLPHKLSTVLTKREYDILNWMKQGKTSWEISVIVNISERTVNFHIQNLIRKLGASNRTHAVAIACSQGFISL